MPFYPGHQYSAKAQRLSRALERALAADDWKRLHQGCDRLADAFAEGQAWALQMVFDRVEGRSRQQVDITSSADARGLDLAQVVQAVLAARATNADDAHIVNANHSTNENHSHLALESAQPDSSESTPTP